MRVHSFLFATSVVLVAAAAAVQACGGDTSSANNPVDAGNDATKDVAVDNTNPPVMDAGQDTNTCDPNADFIKKIPGDADIGDGESSLGLCASCVEDKCHKEVMACNMDCKCQGVADKVLVCVAMSGGDQTKLIQCALSMGVGAGALSTTSEALVACVQADCPVACPVPDAGLDANDN